MTRAWTRRDFLRAARIGAAGTALLPFFPTSASAGGSIQRLLLFSHGNGTIIHRWRSNGAGAPLTNGAALPELVGPILAPLERHRSRLTLVDGLDQISGSLRHDSHSAEQPGHHGIATLWSGARHHRVQRAEGDAIPPLALSRAPTLDHLLSDGVATRNRVLVVGTSPEGRSGYSPSEGTCSYAEGEVAVPPENDPRAVFDLLFAGAVDGDDAATRRRRASRRGILSQIRGELGRIRSELPSVDRDRFDAHVAGIDEIDRRLSFDGGGGVCLQPTRAGETTEADPSSLRSLLRIQFDIIRHAFACDLTRFANVLIGAEGTSRYWLEPSELPYDPRTGDMHVASHETYQNGSEDDRRVKIEFMSRLQRQLAEEFALAIDGLSASGLMGETLAVWGSGMGWGGPHVNWSIPFVLASEHPSFAASRYHRFGNYDLDIETRVPSNPWDGPTVTTPHNRLLTSIAHLMGRTDITAVGDGEGEGGPGGLSLDNSPISELFT